MLPFTTVKGDTVSTECFLDPRRYRLPRVANWSIPRECSSWERRETKRCYRLRYVSRFRPIRPWQKASAGLYANTVYESTTPSVSGVLSCPDGNLRFVQAGGDKLTVHTIDQNNPGHLSSSTSIPVSEGGMDEGGESAPPRKQPHVRHREVGRLPKHDRAMIDLEAKAIASKINLPGMDFWAFGARGPRNHSCLKALRRQSRRRNNPISAEPNRRRVGLGKACLDVVRRIYRNP